MRSCSFGGSCVARIVRGRRNFPSRTRIGECRAAGSTDSTYLRNAGIPAYGHSGLANDIGDFRAHGKDERVPVKSFFESQEYLYQLVKMLPGGGSANRAVNHVGSVRPPTWWCIR